MADRAAAEVLVVGAGFAGLWTALGAARRCDELGVPAWDVSITVVSPQPCHDIRVRNYEPDLTPCRIPLAGLLDPVGIRHVPATVEDIDTERRVVTTSAGMCRYDRLVLAAGSAVVKPDIPGLAQFGFDIDTFDAATRLGEHLARLADGPPTPAARTVVVVGAGLTGVELATELPDRLRALFGPQVAPRVVLVDRNPSVGSDMGDSARPVIEAALAECGVEVITASGVTAVEADQVVLAGGAVLPAATVVWCAGMRANPLAGALGMELDRSGRIPVDDCLRVIGRPGIFAAGDIAAVRVDDGHMSVMSCQHARPMGRYAGFNVIGDLLGRPMLSLRIPWYVTVVDLGPAGAVYTQGWARQVVATGAQAKATKTVINSRRIYPPAGGDRAALLAAAAPELQSAPE